MAGRAKDRLAIGDILCPSLPSEPVGGFRIQNEGKDSPSLLFPLSPLPLAILIPEGGLFVVVDDEDESIVDQSFFFFTLPEYYNRL